MATIKFRSAQVLVEFVNATGAIPFATSFELPVKSIQAAAVQPGARNNIVLGVERDVHSGEFLLYHGLTPSPVGADPVLVKLEIKLRVGNKTETDTAIFPVHGTNVFQTTAPSFQTAQFLIYIEQSVAAGGTLTQTLFSVGLGGGGGGAPCAGCDAPANVPARTLCALMGCYP